MDIWVPEKSAERIAEGICLAPLFSIEVCDKITGILNAASNWNEGLVPQKGGSGVNLKKRNQLVIQYKFMNSELRQFSDQYIRFVQKLIPLVAKDEEETRSELCQFQKTETGGHFQWHRDQDSGMNRKAVSILYLTDASDGLIGGSTDFEINDKILNINSKKGSVLLFDPSLKHRGFEVFGGKKLALVSLFIKKSAQISNTEKNSMLD